MADPDRRGEHRATVFEQEGQVGGYRRSDREDQSKDHRYASGLCRVGRQQGPVAGAWMILPGSIESA
jgi:hypothetical protein